jgi:Zn-finger nucleic acid-binding protein
MTGVNAAYDKTVDRCNECHGLFVSRNAMQLLERDWFLWPESDSHSVDSGDPIVGKRLDEIGEIDCPACGAGMAPIFVPDQPHIWLEQCPACQGVFFDAGELTDLRYCTMADWVRDFLKGPRPS